MPTADIVTLAEARQHLNITSSTQDVELQAFIDRASDMVEHASGNYYRTSTQVETFDGGTSAVVLSRLPVASLTSIVADGVALSSSSYSLNMSTGLLRYKYGTFPGDYDDLVVTYVTGSTVDALAKQATLEVLRHLWQTQRGAMGSRAQMAGDGYDPSASYSLPRRAQELLSLIAKPGGIA